MAADDLSMQGARASAALVLSKQGKPVLVFHEEGFPLSVLVTVLSQASSFRYDRNLRKCKYFLNSLAPGKFECNFQMDFSDWWFWGRSCEIALIVMSLDFTDHQSTLVQVMAWCRQATSHYLSECWPRSLSPYGITRPQWVNEALCATVSYPGHE